MSLGIHKYLKKAANGYLLLYFTFAIVGFIAGNPKTSLTGTNLLSKR
jgi:hypothetical protein